MNIRRAVSRTMAGAALLIALPACSDKFLQVENPNLIDATTVDPNASAAILANSAQQDYQNWYGSSIMYSGWFTGEINVSDTFPTRNEFGYRQVENLNGDLTTYLWGPVSVAAAEGKSVLDLALPTPTTNIIGVQAAMFRAYTILDMATDFCQLSLSGSVPLTQKQGLDSAIYWFTKAITIGNANGTAAALTYVNASLVGRARAYLQEGNLALATTDANAVPAAFNYNLQYVQDLTANETRLVNRMWQFTFDRGSTDVPMAYRVGDPRVKWILAPGPGYTEQDVIAGHPYGIQQKYPAYASPIRLASGIEAGYIIAEASANPVTQLAWINTQRVANGQGAYTGATDAASVMTELYNQRAREFWLEGRKIGDLQRSAASTTFNFQPAGSVYYKPGYPNVGTQTCIILPYSETSTNVNFPH